MKRKRFLALFLSVAMVAGIGLPTASMRTVQAEETTKVPIFEMDFENLEEEAGDQLSGTITANSGETVTVYDNVSLVEGHNGGKAVDLSFNKGYLTVPNTDKLNPESLTVSVWLRRVESANQEARVMWAKPNNSWNGNGWFIGWTTGESMALVTDGRNMAVQKASADTLLPLNEWTNITGVFDGETGDMILYQDGVSFASAQVTGASITKSTLTDILIGKSGYGAVGIGCYADDFKIYDKALTAREVALLAGLTEQELLDADVDALTTVTRATSDFVLSLEGANGSVITWESDNEAIKLDGDGNAVVTRSNKDVKVTLTAELTLGESKATKTFEVTVVKENQPIEGVQKLSSDEIVSVGGTIGKRLSDAVDNYAMNYLYGQRMTAYLNEYKNHSHSGWSWLEGEQPGKWLESMSNYKWMNDSEIDAAIKDVVTRLAETQTVEDKSKSGYNQFGGYLGNATTDIRNNTPVKGMDPYEMYSTLNGLINVYDKYKEDDTELAAQAIDCAIKLADYLVATIGDENTKVCYQDGTQSGMNKKEFWPLVNSNGTTIAGHDVHQSWEGALIIDPMMLLSKTVKEIEGQEEKSTVYSDWVDWVIGNIDKWASSWNGYGDTPYGDLDKVASGEMGIDEIQHYVHAHTFQMTFLGFLKKYQETGDETYLNKVTGAWEDIVSRQVYITGTTSVGEHYEAGHNLPNTGSVGETCATNSWTLLNNNLFELTGDARYQQVVEDVIYNHMFATSTIDGDGYSYHRPLNGSTERFYTGPDCCSSSGMRMQSYVPYYIYTKSASGVYVNQFIESEAQITLENGKMMNIKQTTDYPSSDDIKLEILDGTTEDTLYVRVPDWVEEPTVKVNGTAVADVAADGYVELSVAAGDTVEITYPSEPVWVEGDYSNEGSWAIKDGPMVYCVDAAFMTVEESQAAFGADIAPVAATAVVDAEDGKAVKTEREIALEGDRYFGSKYIIKMMTPNGEQEVAIVPYANIGQWYRYGEAAPGIYGTNYSSATRYSYMIWMPSGITDYPEAPEESSGPVVHYDFDSVDGTTIKDISGNGKDAEAVGAVSYDTGKLGKGVSLNGTDAYVKLPEDVIYGLYNLSISAWINPEEVVNWARVFDFGNGEESPPYPNLFLTVHSSDGKTRLAYEDGGNSHVNTDAFAINTWTHITVTIEGTKAALYVNGAKVAENTSFHMMPFQIGNMTSNFLGKSNYKADSLFKGDMDDFRIYNRALGSDEIMMLASGEEPVRTIQTVEQPQAVETMVGTAPILPEKANVTYTNGTQGREPITWEEITPSQYAKAGTFKVKGTVGMAEIEITVVVKDDTKPDPVVIESITVTAPTKTEYTVGDELDLDGMKVTAKYSDGTTKDIAVTDCEVSGYDTTKTGEQTVTVTYEGKADTFKVTVKEAEKPNETDKTALEAAVKAAVADTEKVKYTEESWAAYEEALNQAKEVLADTDATQKEIDDAAAALDEAAKALQKKELPYVDVVKGDWFYDGAYYNYFAGTMTGTDPTHFSPYATLVRAQFATILYRLNGEPKVEYETRFPDVPDGQFYSKAVIWAAEAEVVTGYTDSGYFGTNDPITREQMVTMMYRYADHMGYEFEEPADISKFTDADKVTEFAEAAMKWAVGNGIIEGKENEDGSWRLDPQGNTSRAECAIIIQRFMKTFVE